VLVDWAQRPLVPEVADAVHQRHQELFEHVDAAERHRGPLDVPFEVPHLQPLRRAQAELKVVLGDGGDVIAFRHAGRRRLACGRRRRLPLDQLFELEVRKVRDLADAVARVHHPAQQKEALDVRVRIEAAPGVRTTRLDGAVPALPGPD
jgi:hypothetical protein